MPAAKPAVSFVHAAKGLPTTGQWKCDPRVVDVDGDGTQEIVALPRLLKGARMYLMQDGLWQDASAGLESDGITCGGGLEVLDLNGDGRNDLTHARASSNDEGQGGDHMKASSIHRWVHADVLTGGSDEEGINLFLGDGTGVNWDVRRIAAQAGMVHPVDAARL